MGSAGKLLTATCGYNQNRKNEPGVRVRSSKAPFEVLRIDRGGCGQYKLLLGGGSMSCEEGFRGKERRDGGSVLRGNFSSQFFFQLIRQTLSV